MPKKLSKESSKHYASCTQSMFPILKSGEQIIPIKQLMRRNKSYNVSRKSSFTEKNKLNFEGNLQIIQCKDSELEGNNCSHSKHKLTLDSRFPMNNYYAQNKKIDHQQIMRSENVNKYVYIGDKQLQQFTKKCALEKANLEESIDQLTKQLVQKQKMFQDLQKKYESANKQKNQLNQLIQQIKNQQIFALNNLKSEKQQIYDIHKGEKISLSNEIIKLKLDLETQKLQVQRSRSFLSIKEEIITKLNWEINNKQANLSQNQISLQFSHPFDSSNKFKGLSSKPFSKQKSVNKKIIIKKQLKLKENLEKIKQNMGQRDQKEISIMGFKQSEKFEVKMEGLFAAVRDRDITIVQLKSQNQKLAQKFNKLQGQLCEINQFNNTNFIISNTVSHCESRII